MINLNILDIYIVVAISIVINALSFMIILPCSAFIYRRLLKTEPELFNEKNICYYLTQINSTQFIFYILFNCHKKIKNKKLSNTCYYLRNITYILLTMLVLTIFTLLICDFYLAIVKH